MRLTLKTKAPAPKEPVKTRRVWERLGRRLGVGEAEGERRRAERDWRWGERERRESCWEGAPPREWGPAGGAGGRAAVGVGGVLEYH